MIASLRSSIFWVVNTLWYIVGSTSKIFLKKTSTFSYAYCIGSTLISKLSCFLYLSSLASLCLSSSYFFLSSYLLLSYIISWSFFLFYSSIILFNSCSLFYAFFFISSNNYSLILVYKNCLISSNFSGYCLITTTSGCFSLAKRFVYEGFPPYCPYSGSNLLLVKSLSIYLYLLLRIAPTFFPFLLLSSNSIIF